MRKAILFLVTVPHRLTLSYPYVLLLWATGLGTDLHVRQDLTLAVVLREKVRKWWRWSTTIGFGQAFHLDHLANFFTRAHERVHQRQFQDDALRGLVLGGLLVATGSPLWVGAFVWWVMPILLLTNFVTAALRGAPIFPLREVAFYYDAEHERGARAQAEKQEGSTTSWEQREEVFRGRRTP